LVLVGSVGLLTSCAAEGRDPLGPDAGLQVRAAEQMGASPSARQGGVVQFGDFALYLPANVNRVRGILVALGGPDTRGFAAGTPFGAPFPPVEAALQELGVMFRDLAEDRGLAILGSGRFGPGAYPDGPASDQLLLDALSQAATLTGREDLLDAPMVLYGLSGGAPEAAGFTQRNPHRVAALFLRVPQSVATLDGEALEVPVYMILAELDVFVDNAALIAAFQAHRAQGAPWAMALERGVPHHALSAAQRELTVGWMRAVLPLASTRALSRNSSHAGWLGDPANGAVAPVSVFVGEPSQASWFPARRLAQDWATFIGF